jgi:aerobic carbon-monoxide dehydrogenase large subunit
MTQHARSQWIGHPLRRLEDDALLCGRGRYADDLDVPGAAHAMFHRSPHAHAEIRSIDVSAARAVPGVIAVFTGRDVIEAGLKPLPFNRMHKRPDGAPMHDAPRYALTPDAARYVGDPVAMVVAETRDQARDAADLIEIDWMPRPAVTDLAASGRDDAPVVWPQAFAPGYGNIAAVYRKGDREAVDAAFARAARVVEIALVNNRVVGSPLEPRSAIARYDAAGDKYHLHCPTQNTHALRMQLAEAALGIAKEKLRVTCDDLGGSFGLRGHGAPEYAALLFAARRLGRPVRWRGDRSEMFFAEAHGRDNVSRAALALDGEHRFLALRIRTLANIGAYVSNFGASVPAMSGVRAASGAYDIPLIDHEVRMLFTHTTPVDAYRGAGRPEAGYLVERLVSRAARELGLDPVDLRRRNLVPPAKLPYENAIGAVFDSGDFPGLLERALELADWKGFEQRRKDAERRGRLAGRGIAFYIEVTGSARLVEGVRASIDTSGAVTLLSGTQSMGTGLATAYAQIAADVLGLDPHAIRTIQGDTDLIASGGGSGGSRSLQVGGSAVRESALALVAAARKLAAEALEAAEADLEFADGSFRVAGTDRVIELRALAARAPEGRIVADAEKTVGGQSWPNGCQICEVEIDPESGTLEIVRHTAIDDIGTVVNPLVAEGQMQGGMAQGFGQALIEHCVYDRESGQLLTGSFMDYAMPRAADMPKALQTAFDEHSPTSLNPLGAKGAGEAGTHGACPSLVNAVLDALAPLGVTSLDMPLTSEKIWRAIGAARR